MQVLEHNLSYEATCVPTTDHLRHECPEIRRSQSFMDSALTTPTCMYQAQHPDFNEILQVLSFLYRHGNLRIVIPSFRSRQSIQNKMSGNLLCLAIMFPAKLVPSGTVARNLIRSEFAMAT